MGDIEKALTKAQKRAVKWREYRVNALVKERGWSRAEAETYAANEAEASLKIKVSKDGRRNAGPPTPRKQRSSTERIAKGSRSVQGGAPGLKQQR
jgi:hypothetical protein